MASASGVFIFLNKGRSACHVKPLKCAPKVVFNIVLRTRGHESLTANTNVTWPSGVFIFHRGPPKPSSFHLDKRRRVTDIVLT